MVQVPDDHPDGVRSTGLIPTLSGRQRRSISRVVGLGIGLGLGISLLPGCGDSGPSLAAWVRAADEVCGTSQKEAEQSRPVLTTPSFAEVLRKSSLLSKQETNQLRDLEKPGERREEVRDYIAALDERTTAIDVYLASLSGGLGAASDLEADLDRIADATQKAADLAKQLGLQTCLAGIDMSIGDAAGQSEAESDEPVTEDPTADPTGDPADGGGQSVTTTREFVTEDGAGEG